MEIALRFHNEDKTQKNFFNLHVKLLSPWSDCITTATIAEGSATWEFEEKELAEEGKEDFKGDEKDDSDTEEIVPIDVDNSQTAMWNQSCKSLNFGDKSILKMFNTSPGLYAFLFGYDADGQIKVLTFTYVDCSGLLMDHGAVSVRSFRRFGMCMDLKVHCKKPLVSISKLMPLEPLVLDLGR